MDLRSLQWRILRSVQNSRGMRDLHVDWIASGLLKKGRSKGGLAKALGVHQSQVTRILDGDRKIKTEEVPLIARYLGTRPPSVNAAGQHIESSDVLPPEPEGEKIITEDDRPFADALPQMVGRIGGGSTGAVITIDVGNMQSREEVGEWWRIPPAVLRGLARADVSRTVGFAMDGDSMEPTIQRTDIVFIDTGRQRIEPDGIWAVDYGLGRTLKRIAVKRLGDDVHYVLKSDNKSYPDEEYAADEVTVFGRYIGRFSVF